METLFTGVIERKSDKQIVKCLPYIFPMNASICNVPLYVLHSTASKKLDAIEVSWERVIGGCLQVCKFSFRRDFETPFPILTHAKILDVLLGMFSQAWNEDGEVLFRYSDVNKLLGKSKDFNSKAIQEAIKRYRRHSTEWINSWNGRTDTLNFVIIERSSILDSNENIIRGKEAKNPRNSKKRDEFHSVTFHKEVVQAIKHEHSRRRFILSSLIKELSDAAYVIYRYYYGFNDSEDGKPKFHFRKLEDLSEVFKWTGQKNRFKPWIEKQLNELHKKGLINEPIWNGEAVGVHCKNFTALLPPKGPVIDVTTIEPLKKNGKPPKVKASNATDEIILAEFLSQKSKGSLPEDVCLAVDALLKIPSMKSEAVSLAKRALLTNLGKGLFA